MSTEQSVPPDLWALLGALLVATISGFVSIAQRIVRGHTVTLLWVVSEFASAILCGWIAWDAYPRVVPYLPEWMTPIMFVAIAAHSGGRTFQGVENLLYRRYGIKTGPLDRRR